MELNLPKNKTYVAAISGGVDSMVLLDLLIKNSKQNNWSIIVAHVNHGIRPDSLEDESLVKSVAEKNSLVFESTRLELGEGASEALARSERYAFLESVKTKHNAAYIITAHHQDDLVETAILNLIRGTGRKGLSALKNNEDKLRPLLEFPKSELIKYAKSNNVVWREDSTNSDTNYLRNYIRLELLPRFDASARLKLISLINNVSVLNKELDEGLDNLIKAQDVQGQLNRNWFNSLSHSLAKEIMATWFRQNDLAGFSRDTLERLVVSAKVARVGQHFPITGGRSLIINKESLCIVS